MFSLFIKHEFAKSLNVGDYIDVVGVKFNPYHTPTETYNFNYLPFCLGQNSNSGKSIGIKGKSTLIKIYFLTPMINSSLCSIQIDSSNYQKFSNAIHRQFIYELYVGKLPLWARVGTEPPEVQSINPSSQYIFTHYSFSLYHRDNHIVEVNMVPESPVLLQPNSEISFSYSAEWLPSTKHYRERFTRYYDYQFFKHKTRIFAFYNSAILTLLLVFLTLFILISFLQVDFRVLEIEKNTSTFDLDFNSDRGWRNIHGDVFRQPSQSQALSILIGFGAQLMMAVIGFIVANLVLRLYKSKKSLYKTATFLYSISAFIGGYFSAGFYKHWGGEKWTKQLTFSSIFIPIMYSLYQFIVWIAEVCFGTKRPFYFTSMIGYIAVTIFVIFPLTFAGGLLGRHRFIFGKDPAATAIIPRKIPKTPFYLRTFSLMFIIGV